MRKTLIQTLFAAFCAILATAPLEGGGVMLINMRNAMLSGGKRTPTAKDYVQDGLVAMWDGIENAGWGVHNPNATMWKDLVGSNDLSLTDISWNADSATFSMTTSNAAGSTTLNLANMTISATVRNMEKKNSVIFYAGGSKPSISLTYSLGENRFGYVVSGPNEGQDCFAPEFSANGYYAITRGNWRVSQFFMDAQNVLVSPGSSYITWPGSFPLHIGYRPNNTSWTFKGDLCNVLVYSRTLTAAEIAANYAIDKARFNLPNAT